MGRPASSRDIKDAVRERDGYQCVDCGMTHDEHIESYGRTLDVHRTTPGSVYTMSGCETLCRACHTKKPKGTSPSKKALLFPGDWGMVIKTIANRRMQPTSWFIISLIEDAAKEAGLETPVPPWGIDNDDDEHHRQLNQHSVKQQLVSVSNDAGDGGGS